MKEYIELLERIRDTHLLHCERCGGGYNWQLVKEIEVMIKKLKEKYVSSRLL
jgi:hypothetical protein